MTAVSNSNPSAKGSVANSSLGVDQPEFVLKHRIAGAAFLLFFGALVLPWILGAPGEAKTASTSVSDSMVLDASDEKVLDESLVSAIAGEELEIEEQVYISKITPLDTGAANEPSSAAETSNTNGTQANTGSVKEAEKIVATKSVSQNSTSRVSENTAGPATKPASTPAKVPATIKNTVAESNPVAKSSTVESGAKPVATESVVAATTIEVGWVVQVGVFTDKKGAARVVEDLESKGFSPSTTIVDTNRGKATGTRIWLGPFAQRVDAAKAKSDLTEKTGEAGFIRAYP